LGKPLNTFYDDVQKVFKFTKYLQAKTHLRAFITHLNLQPKTPTFRQIYREEGAEPYVYPSAQFQGVDVPFPHVFLHLCLIAQFVHMPRCKSRVMTCCRTRQRTRYDKNWWLSRRISTTTRQQPR